MYSERTGRHAFVRQKGRERVKDKTSVLCGQSLPVKGQLFANIKKNNTDTALLRKKVQEKARVNKKGTGERV